MGNQVIVIVPFSKFKIVRKLDIIDIISSDIHNQDLTVIKNIKLGSYPDNFLHSQVPSKDLICSHYHHAEDCVSLYVDHENLVYFPNYRTALDETSTDNISTLISNYRNYTRLSVTKNKRTVKQLKDCNEKYFVFGFLTDNLDSLTNDCFANMLDYAEKMEVLSNNESIYATQCNHSKYYDNASNYHLGKFVPIAVLNSNQFAVVTMKHNVFYLNSFAKNAHITPSMIEVKDFDKPKEAAVYAFRRNIVESLGYTVKPK